MSQPPESPAPAARSDEVSWARHVEDFRAVRQATLTLFRSLPAEAWMQNGSHVFAAPAGGAITEVTIDPDRRLPDRDRTNNSARPQ